MMKVMEKPVALSTALLKVKTVNHPMNPENMSFEDYIESPNTLIKIEFPDGKALVEEKFRSASTPMDRFYIEFFDEINRDDMISYLANPEQNYRVTSLEGSVVRLSKEDEALVSSIGDSSIDGLQEFVFQDEKVGFFQRIKRKFQKKDA